MPLIVQKFGGTSVADSEKILAAARKAIRAQQDGNQVVMVVSAMGKNTDLLLSLAAEINDHPPARELDMLLSTGEQVSVALMAMAINSLGHKGVSLTGGQIGIKTDSTYTKARIRSISTQRMQRLLDEGNIVIAAGFQGIDENFDITTLGRGGSDTTAVALAAVLQADACEIYTDVDGVYTTDPRVSPQARRMSHISYDEMLELASLGAGVMHSRAVEFAKKFAVPIHVRSSFTDLPGTLIVAAPESPDAAVGGAALTKDEVRISALGVPDVPGSILAIFSQLAHREITVDMIVQNIGLDGKADVSFTTPREELADALAATRAAAQAVGADQVTYDELVSKISVVGLGMERQTGVADKMFRALSEADINIQMITTSEIKISVLVERESAQRALRAVHDAFELEKPPEHLTDLAESNAQKNQCPLDVVALLQGAGMEDLIINAVTLDTDQSRVTINGVPDSPGVATKVFEEVAAAGVFVDMIVQSHHGNDALATLTFTAPKADLKKGVLVAENLAKSFHFQSVTSSGDVAKLSVSGIGLRSHTSVGMRMFRTLAEAGINVGMINTSEVRVNVVVDGSQGEKALACLQAAFADVMQ